MSRLNGLASLLGLIIGNIGTRIYQGVSVNANLKAAKFWSLNIYTELINKRDKGIVNTSSFNINATNCYINMNNHDMAVDRDRRLTIDH